MTLLEKLKQIPQFVKVPSDQLKWLLDKSECLSIRKGACLFEPGSSIDHLFIVMVGDFIIRLQKNNQLKTIGEMKSPAISGLLPYSRADVAKGFGEATSDAEVVVLDGKHFREMICDCHELTTALVHEMSSRIRQFTKREQLDDKMLSLGKLSAGLAHELNNPSAAVVRSSKALSKHLKFLPEKFKDVVKIQMTDEKINRVNQLLFDKLAKGIQKISLLDRGKKEDELIDWLSYAGFEDPDDVVDNLIDYGFELSDLEQIGEDTPTEHQPPVINWINQVLSTERLVVEIEHASQRINDLVSSVKRYTHMDQAPEKVKTDVHTGLDNTLTMLNHKIQDNEIKIEKNYGENLTMPEILPSAMNQVWTNILDNAIDAMEESEERTLNIKTEASSNYFKVEIKDTGSGIPDEIKDQIFDPFFTTKPVGKGTGLGLENVLQIVKIQHQGLINVESGPGKTVFTVCLPL
ncbi:MAG: ATP-binding protein [Bacteroidota bacterium]